MNTLLLHCRPGFEKECAAEIQDSAATLEVYGFPRLEKDSGFVLFECYQNGDADKLMHELDFHRLIFARSWFCVVGQLTDMPLGDRVGAVLAHAKSLPKAGKLWVESADGDAYRQVLPFCKKLTVPLRQGLRKQGILTAQEREKMPRIHLFLIDNQNGYVGYSRSDNGSPFYMGIPRLKFPSDAPSRSTLKLDEAFLVFLSEEEAEERLHGGLYAVDLGACPGGWTYQLVRRGMFVSSVDNGAMADSLMETGQVTHFAEDGFKFVPDDPRIHWMVCDMADKPHRVAARMATWIIEGWCQETIFNLKLPMKQRYQAVAECFGEMTAMLRKAGVRYGLQAKHLYHDREEITVHLYRIR
ncbi:23S rRNA (cytidine(2498)-2'-O)-methyltransferase RlmM [Ferrimonas sediminicola]|uniref:Ribosomal RNA large subunit methyltransferase M n=1 Tax=Ferrimonas sediminicola TaxID=2569538 RepID=A0A4U1BFJ7_9GAMM|nr:23S rRNA (cytidine(2498)-2'-O)-methyltransferase RlmM [Ferrimonas sediminicola]TKB49457.1 23S rRNA (cytidine(2498)-2'-O)-methyltransferase RlmM [Ferrimonas sediminicola]